MFQQRAESEGVQPSHHNNMPNSISEEPINRLPFNLGGSAHQSQLFYMPNSSLEEPIHQLPSNLGGSAHQSDQFFPGSDVCYTVLGWLKGLLWKAITQLASSSNQGGSAHQPQLSEAQFLANELWRGLVQPNVNRGGWLSPTRSLGVQPNVNPGHSVQQDVNRGGWLSPTQSLGVQPNVNPGQSVPQDVNPGGRLSPTQSEDQFDIRTADGRNHYRPLYHAAQKGDWKAAICFIYNDPNALTAKITASTGRTVLHVAAYCCQWEFVLKLLEHIPSPASIAVQTKNGNTVLHHVAQGGSLKTAKALIQINSDLPQIKNQSDRLPLVHSIWSGNKKLVRYLSLKNTDESSRDRSFSKILRYLIISGYHDIALHFVKKYPHLALAKDDKGRSLLYWLATNPSGFFSGSNLGFLERWIYKYVHVDIRNSQSHLVMVNTEDISESILECFTTLESRSFATQVLRWFKGLFWKTIAQLVAYVGKVRDAKLKHESAVVLVKHVCLQLSSMSFQELKDFLLNPTKNIMASAVTGGIEEIVEALFQQFPDLIDVPLMPEGNILQSAIKHRQANILQTAIQFRQEKIVNIIKEIFPTATKNMSADPMKSDQSTTLHLAGELAPQIKLLSVPGAALQMQRELQWFKEVEEIVFPDEREKKNKKKETPKEVFREKHKDLAKDGEKWMKDTAGSCMVVSALIATVLFAAAFTVPGGNMNDKGIPIFLRTNAFTIFAISDALGLFSSLSSLLMFLAILTARYEIEDFLESLPNKLTIGLGSLFVAIASMIIAFEAALTIVLSERWNRVFVPVTLLASLPVGMFVWLQLPLFVQMVQSTCGASIFRPWPSRKFE